MSIKTACILLATVVVASTQPAAANDSRFPYCASALSDSDGDGYGWENEKTCLVAPAGNTYSVTISNLTYQQVLSPIMSVTHDSAIGLIAPGQPAGAGITAIAEGGDVSVLQGELSGVSAVGGTAVSDGPVPPAMSASYEIHGNAGQVISVVSMLVNTNDALLMVDSLKLPSHSGETVKAYALAYDAGTETNDENCAHIPGPACGGVGASPGDDGEGFVHIHRGLQGVGDLNAERQSWLNPVAIVTVTKN